MKKYILLFFLTFYVVILNAQKLNLTDLISLCNKSNWDLVNQSIINIGWEYFESSKGDDEHYNTITWSFNKESFSDKAQAWFHLYTFEGLPNKITYQFFNKESFNYIQKTIQANGFVFSKNEIEDNEVISTYNNFGFILIISTSKKVDPEWSNSSNTSYLITVIKKTGIYDTQNGSKTDFYEDGFSKKSEYILKNGKLNGLFKVFYKNGNLKKIGTYINDEENGTFKEYDESGELISLYTKKNGEYNGLLIKYKDANIVSKITYINGVKNGKYDEYSYGEDGKVFLEYSGNYINDQKDGIFKLWIISDNKKELASFTTFKNDNKNGKAIEINGDSLIFCNYINDKLNGSYIVYFDLVPSIFGLPIRTDTSKLEILAKGNYFEDMKIGKWQFYELHHVVKEGSYFNDLKTGVWNYYYIYYSDGKDGLFSYNGKLFLNENYLNDKLNGKSERFSYSDKIKYPCDRLHSKNKNALDTCSKLIWSKISEISNYKDDDLNGQYLLKDSIGNILLSGNYVKGQKVGFWLESSIVQNKDLGNKYLRYFQEGKYINQQKDGKWIEYLEKGKILNEYNYSLGKLNGNSIFYNNVHKVIKIKKYDNGSLKSYTLYDPTGERIIRKYEILNETIDNMNVRKIDYNTLNIISIVYTLDKKDSKSNSEMLDYIFYLYENNYINESRCYPDGVMSITDGKNIETLNGVLYKKNKIGVWYFNYPQQDVHIQIDYSNSNQQIEKYYYQSSQKTFKGKFEFLDSENSIKEIRNIRNGLRNGKTIYLDFKTNKIIKTEKFKDGVLK